MLAYGCCSRRSTTWYGTGVRCLSFADICRHSMAVCERVRCVPETGCGCADLVRVDNGHDCVRGCLLSVGNQGLYVRWTTIWWRLVELHGHMHAASLASYHTHCVTLQECVRSNVHCTTTLRGNRYDNMVRLKSMKGGLTIDNVLKMSQQQVRGDRPCVCVCVCVCVCARARARVFSGHA